MLNKSANLLQSKPVKEMHSGKKLSTTNSSSLNSNITSVQRVTQKRRYYRSATAWRSAKLKYRRELSIVTLMKTSDLSSNYHPWESEYNKIIIREKKIKSMTKDPYTPFSRLISQAVENVTTESECYPILIPAKDVQIQTFNIQNMSIPPKPLLPTMVRYVRRHELMPSQRPITAPIPMKISSVSQSQTKTSNISVQSNSKITSIAPTLATADRLLNRDKIRNDPSVIRRPPRRLIMNPTHEIMMPLSVYG